MAFESPASILYNTDGIEMAVSGGVAVPVSTSALLMAGITSDQTASVIKVAPGGEVFVTGTFTTTPSGIQNVALTNTASVQVINTASVQVFNTASVQVVNTASVVIFNTASVRLTDVIAGTGSVAPITGVLVGGKDGSGNFQTFAVNSAGVLSVNAVNTASVQIFNTASVQVVNTASVQVFNTASVRLVDVIAGTGSVSPITGVLVGGKDTSGNFQAFNLATNGVLNVNLANTASVDNKNHASTAVTSVAASVTSVTLLASNANRRGATIVNDGSKNLYVKLGATASTTSFTVKITAQGYYEVPFWYSGVVDGIWDTANGSARITEVTD